MITEVDFAAPDESWARRFDDLAEAIQTACDVAPVTRSLSSGAT